MQDNINQKRTSCMNKIRFFTVAEVTETWGYFVQVEMWLTPIIRLYQVH